MPVPVPVVLAQCGELPAAVSQDGVKIDGCGKMNNMEEYGLNITIEDCHDSNSDQGQSGL